MATMRRRLTRIEPFSAAIMGGATGFALGFLNGLGTVLFFPAMRQGMSDLGLAQLTGLVNEWAKAFPFAFEWPALLLSPIAWAFGGAGGAFAACIFYNLLAKRLGGIEFELDE
jgi:hypothetical protein